MVAQKCTAFGDPEGHHRACMDDIKAMVMDLRAEMPDEAEQRAAVRDLLWWCFDYFQTMTRAKESLRLDRAA